MDEDTEDHNVFEFGKSDVRLAFIRKVYLILST